MPSKRQPQQQQQYVTIPKPVRPTNPTPLELMIYQYELLAREFHNSKNRLASPLETAAEKADRIAKRDRDVGHLRLERRKLTAHIKQQQKLTQYRSDNKNTTIDLLASEKHHPTNKLARNLTAIGEPKPTKMHEPHHIIPGVGKYQQVEMAICRLNLHAFGVGINDPINGVWLRNFSSNNRDDWATPDSPAHRPLHTFNYETWIGGQFLNDNLPENVFLTRLQNTKRKLKDGTHPPEIIERGGNAGGTTS